MDEGELDTCMIWATTVTVTEKRNYNDSIMTLCHLEYIKILYEVQITIHRNDNYQYVDR